MCTQRQNKIPGITRNYEIIGSDLMHILNQLLSILAFGFIENIIAFFPGLVVFAATKLRNPQN